MADNQNRSPWYLITGLIIGVLLGILASVLFNPIRQVEILPGQLSVESKDAYRIIIAESFVKNPDLVRTSTRLQLLEDADPIESLSAQAQHLLASSGDESQATSLAALAGALKINQSTITPSP